MTPWDAAYYTGKSETVPVYPFNQPPYLASGDISSRVCTIIGETE